LEIVCPHCAHANRSAARFCESCGNQLATAAASALTHERTVVTELSCDLVGFTALSEGVDLEDVDRMPTGYVAMARTLVAETMAA
jgi:class 3 adenylate cyclase